MRVAIIFRHQAEDNGDQYKNDHALFFRCEDEPLPERVVP